MWHKHNPVNLLSFFFFREGKSSPQKLAYRLYICVTFSDIVKNQIKQILIKIKESHHVKYYSMTDHSAFDSDSDFSRQLSVRDGSSEFSLETTGSHRRRPHYNIEVIVRDSGPAAEERHLLRW